MTYKAATSITSATSTSSQNYTSSTADENALLVSLASGMVTLTNPTVTKSGDSDGGDNCNFYGINSGVIAMDGGTLSITGGTGIDKFIYNSGEGKDVIVGFGDTDLLEITDGFSGIILKYDSSSMLTLKNYTATSFNINGDTYAISGKTLVKS